MPVTSEILRSYRQPRQVMREKLRAGVREDRALAYLMGACFLIFVAQWPRVAREAHLDPTIPLEARLSGALLATMFILPLILYALAAVAHLVGRLMGGRGTFFTARLALFWSLLVVSPLMLLQGLLAGFLGTGLLVSIPGLVVLAMFLIIWSASMKEAGLEALERGEG